MGGLPAAGPDDLDVYVPPELVADLYAPDLVITPGYIGPSDEHAQPPPRPAGKPTAPIAPPAPVGRPWLRLYEIVVVALVAVAVAVPLTLMASGFAGHRPAATPGAGTASPGAAPAVAGVATTSRPGTVAPGDTPRSSGGQARRQASAVP